MLLEIENVQKQYGGVRALDNVTLAIEAGTVTALLGGNGAGKSTLMKCVTGSEIQDSGIVRFGGAELRAGDPHTSRTAGIEMIYQALDLCPSHDGTANIFLGRELTKRIFGVPTPFLDGKMMERRAREIVERLNTTIDLRRAVGTLSGGQQQAIAIARALLAEPKLLIMDEPTAALGPKESARVLDIVRALKSRGIAVVLIAHRLGEVFDVADRIVLMKHGSIVEDLLVGATSPQEIHRKMLD